MRRKVNILVLDTEVYSNTGGQASKSTPLGAAAKFAAAGKAVHKKDLGLMAMSYGHVYVASVAFGAKDSAHGAGVPGGGSYDGPSLIIAYSHCIAHGYDLRFGAEQQKLAVNSGVWPLYRYDPRRVAQGEPPLVHRRAARQGHGRRLHAQRDALPHGGEDRPGALPRAGGGGARPRGPARRPVRATRPHHPARAGRPPAAERTVPVIEPATKRR